MAVPTEPHKSFRLFVSYVDNDGPLLKICGQVDKQSAAVVKNLVEASTESFDKGKGAAPASAILEGIICVAKYKDGVYYRAKVLNVSNLNNGLIFVHFIDYGNRDLVSLSTIRLLESNNPLLQIRGQASDYYLARIVSQGARWEEQTILKLRNWLCYTDYTVCIEVKTCTLPIISIDFQQHDLSQYIASNRYGLTVPIEQQEVLILSKNENRHQPNNWPEYSTNDTTNYNSQIPYMNTQHYSANSNPAMRLQQGLPNNALQNTYTQQPTSAINQRLLAHKTMRTPCIAAAALRNVVRQSPQTPSPTQTNESTVPAAKNPSSPKKLVTYKTRTLEINSTHKVSVSYVENGATNFTVQLLSDAKQLKEMMSEINKRPYRSLSESPTIGEVCLGRFSDDRIISRAIVSNVSNLGCKLYFVDFGDEELVQYYDIFNIPDQFLQHPVFAIKICLSGLKNMNWTPQLDEAFKSLVNDKILTLKVVPAEGPPLVQYGELYYNNMNILELLLSSEQAGNLEFETLPLLPIGYKESVLVSYVDSCLKFYVQLTANIDSLNEVMDAVKVHCEQSGSPGELAAGTACCAKFPDDGNWYRAKVIQTKGQKVVVAYVDYGNEQEVHINDLRNITSSLIQLPAQAMKCALKGFENKPVESKTSNQLEMLALEKTLMAHVSGMLSDNTMLVTLIDESVSPPLDVARKMMQLSTPRSNPEKVTTPIRKDAPNNSFSSPENDNLDDRRRKDSYRREKSFKDDYRSRDNQDNFNPRGGSFRGRDRENKENFERDAGRHSEKFGRQEYGDRRGGKPWETKEQSPQAADDWEEPTSVMSKERRKFKADFQSDKSKAGWKPKLEGPKQRLKSTEDTTFVETKTSSVQDRLRRDDTNTKYEKSKYEKKYERRDDRDSRENRSYGGNGDKSFEEKKSWKDRSQRGGKSNFSPRERAERSFDKSSEHSYSSDRSRTKSAPKEVVDPADDDAEFGSQQVEEGAVLDVTVTWLTSPTDFYVMPLSLRAELEDMMRQLPDRYRGVRPGAGRARAVVARYPADRALYRAAVLERRPPARLLVRYVDFGNKALVADTDVWRLGRDLLGLPRLAIPCALAGLRAKSGADPKRMDACFSAERYSCRVGPLLEDGRRSVTLTAPDGRDAAAALLEAGVAEPETPREPFGEPHYVAHVDSPGQFWLHSFADAERLERLQAELAARADSFPPLDGPAPGSLGCARYSADERWYRAEVLDADADITTVRFVDYGNTDVLGPDALRRLPAELASAARLARRCRLHAAPGGTGEWSEAAADRFAELLLAAPSVDARVVLAGDPSCVELRADGADPAATLVAEGLAAGADRTLCVQPCFASHVGAPDEFWVQLESAAGALADVEDAMAAAASWPPVRAEEGALVAAQYAEDGGWYRARVCADGSAGAELLFVDYGNASLAGEMRALPPELAARPALARKCALRPVRRWGRRASARFEELAAEGATVFGLSIVASGDLSVVDLLLDDRSVADMLLAIEREDEEAARGHARTKGHVCYVHATDEFYVQYDDVTDQLDTMVTELDGCDNFEVESELKVGGLCAAFSSEYEQWYRAKIIELCDVGAHVQFVDYGNKSNCEKFRRLPENLAQVKPLASCYRLAGIDDPNNETYKTKFQNIILDDPSFEVEIMNEEMEPKLVKLYLNGEDVTNLITHSSENPEPDVKPTDTVQDEAAAKEENTDVREEVAFESAIKKETAEVMQEEVAQTDKRQDTLQTEDGQSGVQTDSVTEPDLGSRARGHVCYVHTTDEFYVQFDDITDVLDSMVNELDGCGNFEIESELNIGTLCATFSSEYEQWYRAKIIEFCDVGALVQFVDYGNKSNCEEFRRLPDNLSKVKPLATCYRLAGTDDPNNETYTAKFQNIILDDPSFEIEIVDEKMDPKLVKLYLNGEDVTNLIINSSDTSDVNNSNTIIDCEPAEKETECDANVDLNESSESNNTVIENNLNTSVDELNDGIRNNVESDEVKKDSLTEKNKDNLTITNNISNDVSSTNVILENGESINKEEVDSIVHGKAEKIESSEIVLTNDKDN